MAGIFESILNEASEMFGISARMAEEEACEPMPDPVVFESLIKLTESCRGLMLEAKKRAQDG